MKRPLANVALVALASLPMLSTSLIVSTQPAQAQAPPRIVRRVRLTVLKATALSKFDPKIPFSRKKRHYPDFYVRLGRYTSGPYLYNSETISNRKVAYFKRAKISGDIPKSGLITFRIMLKDRDPDADDIADINPNPTRRALYLTYSANTGKIFSPYGKRLGRLGQTITVQGNLKRRKASITFRIDPL